MFISIKPPPIAARHRSRCFQIQRPITRYVAERKVHTPRSIVILLSIRSKSQAAAPRQDIYWTRHGRNPWDFLPNHTELLPKELGIESSCGPGARHDSFKTPSEGDEVPGEV